MNRYQSTKRVGILGVVFNLFLLMIKLVVGFISNSQSMIADALNSASDIFASFMTMIGNKLASVPRDDDHNFGHGKAEYIFSFLISLSMIALSLKLFLDSLFAILNQEKLIYSPVLVLVCIVTILVKFGLYLYTKSVYKKHKSLLIYSSMKDHRNDAVITCCTLFSIIMSNFNVFFLDGVVGIGISLWIFYTGIQIFMESYHILMDVSLKPEVTEKIVYMVKNDVDVVDVKDIYSISTGYKYILYLTIEVDGNMSTADSHEIANRWEKLLIQEFEQIQQVIIHIEPVRIKNDQVKEEKNEEEQKRGDKHGKKE